jgi:hypothetical protein
MLLEDDCGESVVTEDKELWSLTIGQFWRSCAMEWSIGERVSGEADPLRNAFIGTICKMESMITTCDTSNSCIHASPFFFKTFSSSVLQFSTLHLWSKLAVTSKALWWYLLELFKKITQNLAHAEHWYFFFSTKSQWHKQKWPLKATPPFHRTQHFLFR